jgi:RNA polymerase sigma factor (sigma-70 family)
MVLDVCRSVLHHEHDAEDAFQATFLVLARKAESIRRPDAVAGWLYEVAHHVAVKALASTARRRAQEQRVSPMAAADPTLDMTLRDLRRVLHEELRQLPEKYRLPLVLCYLEGRSQEEAAGQLGWTKGTFRGRLDRGRESLRRRLAARGITLSALLCATAIAPKALADSVVRATASSMMTGKGILSARASVLAEGVTRAMLTGKVKIATAVLFAVGLLAGAAVLTCRVLPARETAKSSATMPEPARKTESPVVKIDAKTLEDKEKDSIVYGGRVLGADGRPVAGAKLHLSLGYGYAWKSDRSPQQATTDAEGRFKFTVPKAAYGDQHTVVAALAPKCGAGWVNVAPDDRRDDLTIRLVNDDVPITGQIVDLEGKPIAGVTLTVVQINAAAGEDLGPFVEAARAKKGLVLDLEQRYLKRFTVALSPKVTTDREGRFRLTGIGRDRLVRAQIDGPTIVSQQLHILTRPEKPFELTYLERHRDDSDEKVVSVYYGSDFRHAAAPTRPIVGVVRDKETGKPLAGVTIQSCKFANNPYHGVDIIETTTDAKGQYRLTGMPRGKGNKVSLLPAADQPYVSITTEVPDSPGLEAVTLDFALKRGVWIEGKITDKVTGKPLHASVEYLSFYRNPNLRDHPGFVGGAMFRFISTREDGSFRIVGLPGPGLIGVYYHRDPYLRAGEREDEFGTRERSLDTAPYAIHFPDNYNALARIDPEKGAEKVKRDISLDPGWTYKGTVLGPDGKPLAGAHVLDLNVKQRWIREPMKTAEFKGGFKPRRQYDIIVKHSEKRLIGVTRPPKENGGAITVRLDPAAAVTGRLVDADGKPRANVDVKVTFRPKGWGFWTDYSSDRVKTDREGRFRIELLLPEQPFRLSDDVGEVPFTAPRAGQTTDLGDVRSKQLEK